MLLQIWMHRILLYPYIYIKQSLLQSTAITHMRRSKSQRYLRMGLMVAAANVRDPPSRAGSNRINQPETMFVVKSFLAQHLRLVQRVTASPALTE